jgi:hypothetical protein
MLLGESAPPRLSGVPGHPPPVRPVDGHGFDLSKERFADGLRLIRPVEFRGHEEHFEELVLPLLTCGDLLPAAGRTLEDAPTP